MGCLVLGDRRAVSPLIAVLIAIAITVAGGLVVYQMFFGTAGTLSKTGTIQVVSADYIKYGPSGSQEFVSITIKNTGNVRITACYVTFYDEDGTYYRVNLGVIEPGQSKGHSRYNPPRSGGTNNAWDIVCGKTYPIYIDVRFRDGGNLRQTITVTSHA
jgi:flagellin-like protein